MTIRGCIFIDTVYNLVQSTIKANINCVLEGREEIGLGFEMTRKSIDVHRPAMVSMECVIQLMELKVGSEKSDAQYMEDCMTAMKMWAYHHKHNTHDYGGEIDRVRCWWAAIAEFPQISMPWRLRGSHACLRCSRCQEQV